MSIKVISLAPDQHKLGVLRELTWTYPVALDLNVTDKQDWASLQQISLGLQPRIVTVTFTYYDKYQVPVERIYSV
jgi:hypothetical protein